MIVIALIIAAVLLLPKLLKKDVASARVTTYNVEEVTFGNVSTTISGSGNLTPVTKETITAEHTATVNSVEFKAGDEVFAAAADRRPEGRVVYRNQSLNDKKKPACGMCQFTYRKRAFGFARMFGSVRGRDHDFYRLSQILVLDEGVHIGLDGGVGTCHIHLKR